MATKKKKFNMQRALDRYTRSRRPEAERLLGQAWLAGFEAALGAIGPQAAALELGEEEASDGAE
jgi:2-polyprenyl-6-methoxyphenol hydroxylase-like FAD-dependent oxidoreductase